MVAYCWYVHASVSGLDQVHWLGLGPYDAYPNKQAAPILGVWGGTAGSPDVTGNKSDALDGTFRI